MPPISLLIKPASGLCNMRCKYCFYADVMRHNVERESVIMNESIQEDMIRKAFEYAEGAITFAFQGGEPTLAGVNYFRRHIRLCEKYNKKKIRVSNSIQTNGYCINDEWAVFFAKNKFLVGVSLDGYKELHDYFRVDENGNGTFSAAIKTTKLFDKYKVDYNILCVVNNMLARRANKVLNSLVNFKFQYLQFIPCIDDFDNSNSEWSLSKENYAKFLIASFDKYYECWRNGKLLSVRNFDNYISILMGHRPESCDMVGACSAYFVVEGNGNVYPCDFYALSEYLGGNVTRHSFSDIMQSEQFNLFVKQSLCIANECVSCRWFSLCRGGCRRYREPFENGLPKLNKFCDSYKMFFSERVEKLMEIARSVPQ